MANDSNSGSVIFVVILIFLGIWCYNLKKENDALKVDLNNYQDALTQANSNIDDANSNIDDTNSAIQDAQYAVGGSYEDMYDAIDNLLQADKIDTVTEPTLTSKISN